jgi:hypothetical protein
LPRVWPSGTESRTVSAWPQLHVYGSSVLASSYAVPDVDRAGRAQIGGDDDNNGFLSARSSASAMTSSARRDPQSASVLLPATVLSPSVNTR